ncbi:hypothetical protein GC194_11665 [bacterium]|nr:hypothetical protein [bacterium]
MQKLIIFILILAGAAAANGQEVKRYNFGKPVTVVSYIKEVIVWKDGVKESAESFAGDKIEIYLSDSVIRITEKEQVLTYPISEVRVDEFLNVTFFQEDGTILHWIRQRRIFQIEPGDNTEEILYYVE